MVVPFKTKNENFRTKIEGDKVFRSAIAKMDEYFLSRNFRTIDFLQHLQSVNESNVLQKQNQTSLEQTIAENTNADIVIYVDAKYYNSDDKYVDLSLKAIDAQTAQILSSAEATSNIGSFDDPDIYIKNAITKCADKFLDVLNKQFLEISKNGRPVKLSITIEENDSEIDFDFMVNDKFSLLDVIDDYINEKSLNGYARCPIKVATKYECDDFRIPIRHPENNKRYYSINDFFRAFRLYFKDAFKINSKAVVIGNSIRITVTK